MVGELVELKKIKQSAKFNKAELRLLLNFYASEVHRGRYKDYALSVNSKVSTYYFYKKNGDKPIFRLLKNLSNKKSSFTLLNQNQNIIMKSSELGNILAKLREFLALVN